MISTVSALLLALAIGVGTNAQTTPQCVQTCQASVASSTGCSGPSGPCGCDTPYQQAMLQCLTRPAASGGCSYDQIISWTNTTQTQCFRAYACPADHPSTTRNEPLLSQNTDTYPVVSPPILPPCMTICPLQAQQAANCSSDTDNACICGTTYTASASSCIKQACADQFQSWNSGHLDLCNAATPSGPISGGNTATTTSGGSTSAGTATTTRSSTTGTTTGTVAAPASSTSQGSGAGRVHLASSGLAVAAMAALTYGVL